MSYHPTLEECLKEAVELLNEARSMGKGKKRAGFLAAARTKASEYATIDRNGAEASYVAGLVMYHSFCDDEEYGARAEAYLAKALSLNPQHHFARMFLGHYYYDVRAYEKALACFESVDETYFTSIDQQWRVLKLHELVLCCGIYLESSDVTEESFDRLGEEFLSVSPEDAPVPFQLVSTLGDTKTSSLWQRIDRGKVRTLTVALIDKLSFSNALKDVIAKL